jgi:FAR1 DNA-binding domain
VLGNTLWTEKRYYVCSRGLSGGASKYQKKHPERQRKIESKKTGCRCKLLIKLYPHTSTILGRYQDEHNHEVGIANIAYMRMSHAARERIKSMLEQKIDPREIVRKTNLSG